MGPQSRVACYASEELQRWFALHGRPTVAQFEDQWWSGRIGQDASADLDLVRETA